MNIDNVDSDDEVAELSEDDPEDDLPLLQLHNILYSAEDLSEEIEVKDLEFASVCTPFVQMPITL